MPDDPNNNERKIVAAGEVAPFDQVSISHRDWLSDAQRKIDMLHDQYWRDGNVLRAWRAIPLAKRGGVARPEWALAYIDRVAQGIYALLDDVLLQESRRSKKSRRSKVPPKHLSSRTLQALGFNKGRGHRSAFADWIARERDAEMVEHLMWLVFPWFTQEPAIEKLDHAYDVVAEQYGVDRSTVVRAAAQYLRDRQDFDGSVDHVSTMKQYVRRHKARRRQEIALFKKAVPGTHSS